MRNELAVGDEITSIGGMVGKIVSIKDDMITFETGEDRVRIQVMRWAISSKGHDVQALSLKIYLLRKLIWQAGTN
jgi:preprotein translocase subunit YajC